MAARKNNNKPTKREPGGGRLIPTQPKADKPFRTFLDAIPREHFEGVLAAQPEESRLRSLLALMTADYSSYTHPPLLVTLCKKAGVTMQDIMNLMKDHAVAEGTVKMMLSLPQVMEDVGQDAKTRNRTCTVCRGECEVEVCDGEGKPTGEMRICLNCEGTGKVREIGDKHSRELLFETAELTNKPRGPLINQNFDLRDTQLKQVLMATQDLMEPGGKP